MDTALNTPGIPPDVLADAQAVIDSVSSGKPLDPAVARRVQERAKQAREAILRTQSVQDIAVPLIRELRGPLDEEQEHELTLVQRDLLRRGERRLIDPETGTIYVLVPEEEYERFRGPDR